MRGHLPEHGAEIRQTFRRQVQRGVPRHQLLEGDAHLLDLERLPVGDPAHPRAPVRLALDEALLLEPDEGGADGRPAGAEQLGQVGLDQPLVGMQAAVHDRLSKGPIGDEAAVRRNLRVGSRRRLEAPRSHACI